MACSRPNTPCGDPRDLEAGCQEAVNMAKDAKNPTTSASRDSSRLGKRSIVHEPDQNSYWPLIVTKDLIPGWLRDNDYIIGGHPMPTYSYRHSFRLWRCLHMETMNIWTHLVGCTLFVATGVGLSSYARSYSLSVSTGDKFAFGISITSAALCFALSTTFHTLRSHSYHVHHFWGRLDIFGICLLAFGAGTAATYYAFFCSPTIQKIYWTLLGCAGLGAAIVLFDTGGGGSKMRTLRGSVFIFLALVALLPIFHSIGKLGWQQACREIGAQWYLSEAMVFFAGVSCFVARFPERLKPGMFDIWGHSHQIHHICAVIGTAFHVAALVTSYKYRQLHAGC